MIHVAMTDEDVADAQHLATGEGREIADVEQHGAPAEPEVDQEPGIAEGLVDETALDQFSHE